jgi:hypothetical protein
MTGADETTRESRETFRRAIKTIEHTHQLHGQVVDKITVLYRDFDDVCTTIDESSCLIYRANLILSRVIGWSAADPS